MPEWHLDPKILIIDDESHIRLLIEQALEDLADAGVEILTAQDGTTGLAAIYAEQPRLVFLDVMMPGLNGFEVCEKVKHDLRMNDIYVVMLTAKGQEYDRQLGEQAGADLFLTKPFEPDQLLELAEGVLGLT